MNPKKFMKDTAARYRADSTTVTTVDELCQNLRKRAWVHYIGTTDSIDHLHGFTERWGKASFIFRVERPNSLVDTLMPLGDHYNYCCPVRLKERCK
jgi:hypothetical protein